MRLFIPIKPRAKGRPRVTRGGHAYTDKSTRDYEKKLKKAAIESGLPKLSGAIGVHIEFMFCIAKSRKDLRDGDYHRQKPDLDNLVKCIDAWNGVLWDDDSQVVVIKASKSWTSEPSEEGITATINKY